MISNSAFGLLWKKKCSFCQLEKKNAGVTELTSSPLFCLQQREETFDNGTAITAEALHSKHDVLVDSSYHVSKQVATHREGTTGPAGGNGGSASGTSPGAILPPAVAAAPVRILSASPDATPAIVGTRGIGCETGGGGTVAPSHDRIKEAARSMLPPADARATSAAWRCWRVRR